MRNKNNLVGILSAISCEVLFGLSYLFTKQAIEIASPFALLGWRFVTAALIMGVGIPLGLVKINLKGKALKPLLLLSFFSPCIYFIGETIGIQLTTTSESGVFLASVPVVSLLASTAILDKKPTQNQIIGILITLTGVILTVLAVSASSSLSIVGYAFLLLGVISYALYSVFVDKAVGYTVTEITFFMLVVGAFVFGTLAIWDALANGSLTTLLVLPFKELTFARAVLYQGIGCSILAFYFSNIAIATIGVNRTASFIGISTLVSIIVGTLLLNEPFSTLQILGAAIIVLGVYTANLNWGNQESLNETD